MKPTNPTSLVNVEKMIVFPGPACHEAFYGVSSLITLIIIVPFKFDDDVAAVSGSALMYIEAVQHSEYSPGGHQC